MKLQTLKPRIIKIDTLRGVGPGTERIRGNTLMKIIKRIAERDGYTCRICHRTTLHGEVDHVVPLYAGGQENDDNRQLLCPACHKVKSEREEEERRGNARV